jgi:hypothetical protein
MTKSELRKARKAARENGIPLTGKLALPNQVSEPENFTAIRRPRRFKERCASREEQHSRYLDCGPQNWDDR